MPARSPRSCRWPGPRRRFELQRLHGMGEGIYREVLRTRPCRAHLRACRRAPRSAGLLVRRLLENGANSSFVHQLADERSAPTSCWPRRCAATTAVCRCRRDCTAPPRQFDRRRPGLRGDARALELALPQCASRPSARRVRPRSTRRWRSLHAGFAAWNARPLRARRAAAPRRRCAGGPPARVLRAAGQGSGQDAGRLRGRGARGGGLLPLLRRTGRSAPGGPAPGAASSSASARGISRSRSSPARSSRRWSPATPWPPSRRSRRRSWRSASSRCCTRRACRATPCTVHGPGETVGAALVAHARTAGVCFTGSTQVARIIKRTLAAKDGPSCR